MFLPLEDLSGVSPHLPAATWDPPKAAFPRLNYKKQVPFISSIVR